MSFKKYQSPKEIQIIMDFFLHQKTGFIVEVQDKESNTIFEGVRPIGAATNEKGKSYSLSNGDSQYQQSIAQVKLDQISKVSLLPSMIPPALQKKLQEVAGPDMD